MTKKLLYDEIKKNDKMKKNDKKNKGEIMVKLLYILLIVTYMIHFTNKKNNTNPVFITLYAALCLCYLYLKTENKIDYNINIGITYALLSMMYYYHMNNKNDSNYIIMGIIIFATTIFKYLEEISEKNNSLTPNTNTPFVLGIISLIYIKHGIIQSEYDYLISSIMYGLLIYTMI